MPAASTTPDDLEDADPVSAWTVSFDLDDPEHCYGSLDDLVSDLSEPARGLLNIPTDKTWYSHADLRDAIMSALDDLDEQLEELDPTNTDEAARINALVADLQDPRDRLQEHGSCQCGLDAWNCLEEDDVNQLISDSVEDTTWALLESDGSAISDKFAPPTVSELWKSLNSRDGWSSVKLAWDPDTRTLSTTFGSYPSMWHGKAVALTPTQVALAGELGELDTYSSDVACVVIQADPDALRITLNLWGDADLAMWADDTKQDPNGLIDDFDNDPYRAIKAATKALAGLSAGARIAAVALSSGWNAGLPELLEAATAVAAPAAA